MHRLLLGKPQIKEIYFLNCRAIKGGGRGVKENITFFILLPFKNKNYFTLDNLSKYGHITSSLSVGIFTGLLQYFPKKGLF